MIRTNSVTNSDIHRHCVDGSMEATLVSASAPSEDDHDDDHDHADGTHSSNSSIN
jgi:hypothetical protein